MKKLILLFLLIIFYSCGVQTTLVKPEIISVNLPELNSVNNSEIGITLVTKESGFKYNAIRITKGKEAKKGYVMKEIKEGEIFYNDKFTKKYDLYRTVEDSTFGIAIPKNGENQYVFVDNGMGINIYKISDFLEYEKTFKPIETKEYFKQEFIYNGRVGSALKFIYREFINDFARPAFTQELQYDISESNTIGFRGLRIEVLSATNTNIKYKVISLFQK